MKKRVISKTLASIHNNLCDSIDDEKTRTLVSKNTVITGGCITSMLLQEKVNDYDLYFRNRETALAVAEYYVKKFKQLKNEMNADLKPGEPRQFIPEMYVEDLNDRVSIKVKSSGATGLSGVSPLTGSETVDVNSDPDEVEPSEETKMALERLSKRGKHLPVMITGNAISLSGRIQLVIRFYGEPSEIHENYDFVHVTNYWTSWDREVVTNTAALECILARELKYVGSLYPICSLIRVRKYVKRGWTVHAGQILKIAHQISKLDLDNFSVLEDQLAGVDVAYFAEVIAAMKDKVKDGDRIESAYLAELIDKLIEG